MNKYAYLAIYESWDAKIELLISNNLSPVISPLIPKSKVTRCCGGGCGEIRGKMGIG
jgi:hypothetical protein